MIGPLLDRLKSTLTVAVGFLAVCSSTDPARAQEPPPRFEVGGCPFEAGEWPERQLARADVGGRDPDAGGRGVASRLVGRRLADPLHAGGCGVCELRRFPGPLAALLTGRRTSLVSATRWQPASTLIAQLLSVVF